MTYDGLFVFVDTLYLAKCSDQKWYRVRIDRESPILKGNDVWVMLVDLGKKELVNLSRSVRGAGCILIIRKLYFIEVALTFEFCALFNLQNSRHQE